MFVGGADLGPLSGDLQGSTSLSPCCSNPSSLDFWLGFFYKFNITKILVIVVSQGRSDEVCFVPFPCSVSLEHAYFPHNGDSNDNKGRPDLLIIFIFTSLPFYQPIMMTYQRLLNILIDILPLLFQHEII